MYRLVKGLTNVDAFGQKIGLNYGGSDSHKTARGGCITLLVYILTLWQSLALLKQLME